MINRKDYLRNKLYLKTYSRLRTMTQKNKNTNQLVHSIQAAGLFDVNTIDAIEGIDDSLTAIGDDGIAQTSGDDLNRHTRLDANTIHALAILGGYLIDGHRL